MSSAYGEHPVLEVAVLDRTKERRKFRRIPAEVLHQLLIDTA